MHGFQIGRCLEVFRILCPEYFDMMTGNDGVMIGSFIRSTDIVASLTSPGDIDVLVIPYEADSLVVSRAVAVEIKIIRASFSKQSKSPNEFGFSQAKAMLNAGFPYVAVGHLIISDQSPVEAWREVAATKVINADKGTCNPLLDAMHDMLPADLLRRSHGRLKANCPDPTIGYFSAYPSRTNLWFPKGAHAILNRQTSETVLNGIYSYYQRNHRNFLWTRRYPSDDHLSDGDDGV